MQENIIGYRIMLLREKAKLSQAKLKATLKKMLEEQK